MKGKRRTASHLCPAGQEDLKQGSLVDQEIIQVGRQSYKMLLICDDRRYHKLLMYNNFLSISF